MTPHRFMTNVIAQCAQGRELKYVVYNGLKKNFLVRANQVGLAEKYTPSIITAYKEHDYYLPLIKNGFFLIDEGKNTSWFFRNANEISRIDMKECFIYWPIEEEPKLS